MMKKLILPGLLLSMLISYSWVIFSYGQDAPMASPIPPRAVASQEDILRSCFENAEVGSAQMKVDAKHIQRLESLLRDQERELAELRKLQDKQ